MQDSLQSVDPEFPVPERKLIGNSTYQRSSLEPFIINLATKACVYILNLQLTDLACKVFAQCVLLTNTLG